MECLFEYLVMLLFSLCVRTRSELWFEGNVKIQVGGKNNITHRTGDILWQRGAKPWQQWHIRVANSSNDGNGGMCHTEQMGETEREKQRERRGCVRKCFGFCIYPWRSGPGKRVECSLSLLSSVRLSGGGKHGAHPPVDYSYDTAKPPYSHVKAVFKHMYSLWETLNAPNTQTQTVEHVSDYPSFPYIFFLSLRLYLSLFQMPVHAQNITTRTCKHPHLHVQYAHTCLRTHAQTHKTTLICSHTRACALSVTH